MTWKPEKPEQEGLWGALERYAKPMPAVPAGKKLGAKPATARTPRPSQSMDQATRMILLKERMVVRLNRGESYESALAAVKRELWPEEYRGE